MNENNPIVISGPSGSGKSLLIDVEKNYPDFLEATGVTTREKRENEIGKMDFITKEEFEKLIVDNDLIEYCTYNHNYYGVSKKEFQKLIDYHLMFNVGYTSAKVIKNLYPNTFMIYLLPPTKEELLRRLGNRGYERYLTGMNETMDNAFNYDYLLISLTDDLYSTTNCLMDIVNQKSESKKRKLTLAKNKDFINSFYK